MNHLKKMIALFFVIVWMLVIFSFSAKNSVDSNNMSKKFLNEIVTTTVKIVRINTTKAKINAFVEKYNIVIRKVAHVSIYLILSIIVTIILDLYGIKNKKLYIYSLLFCLMYSLTDEVHQLSVDGRSGKMFDVMIDNIGISLGLIIFMLHKYIRNNSKIKK